jgi:hypothetical protein
MSQRLRETKQAFADYRDSQRRAEARRTPDLFGGGSWETPESTSDEWTRESLEEIRRVAREARYFTVDDLQIGPTPDRRAIGSVLLTASKRGWITAGGWVPGGAERHGRPIRQWQSRLAA